MHFLCDPCRVPHEPWVWVGSIFHKIPDMQLLWGWLTFNIRWWVKGYFVLHAIKRGASAILSFAFECDVYDVRSRSYMFRTQNTFSTQNHSCVRCMEWSVCSAHSLYLFNARRRMKWRKEVKNAWKNFLLHFLALDFDTLIDFCSFVH